MFYRRSSWPLRRAPTSSLERLLEYLTLPQEPTRTLTSDPPAVAWPLEGAVSFVNVSVVYRPGLPPAVAGFSAELRARERAAVVGRTGAGKSTLVHAPFQCTLCHALCESLCDAPCEAPCDAGTRTLPADSVQRPDRHRRARAAGDRPRARAQVYHDHPAGPGAAHGNGNARPRSLGHMHAICTACAQHVHTTYQVAHNLDPFEGTPRAELLAALQRARLPAKMLEQADQRNCPPPKLGPNTDPDLHH